MLLGSVLLAATTLTLPPWQMGAPGLQIDVPDGYQMEKTEGPDFDVFHISWRQSGGSLGIYVGHHPHEDGVPRSRGVKDIRWHDSEGFPAGGKRKMYGADAILEGIFPKDGRHGVGDLLIHLFARAPSPEILKTLQSAATTLRIHREQEAE